MGWEIQQPEFDEDMKLVNPINYLKPPGGFGDQPGDQEKHDKEGNFKVIKIEPKTDSDDYSHRVRTSDEEPENPIENLNNYDLEEITGGRVHATQESTMDEEQKDTPQLGTSSGAATQVDTWNNAISIQNGLVI